MADDDRPLGITRKTAVRVGAAVRRVENRPANLPPEPAWFQGRQAQTKIAKTGAGGIAAMAGTTPESGTVTLYYFDDTDLVADEEITAYSNWTTAIGANRWIHLTWMYGVPWVSAEDCS